MAIMMVIYHQCSRSEARLQDIGECFYVNAAQWDTSLDWT